MSTFTGGGGSLEDLEWHRVHKEWLRSISFTWTGGTKRNWQAADTQLNYTLAFVL